MRRTRLVALVSIALVGLGCALPAVADPGNNGRGHAYGHDKPKHPRDIPTADGCTGRPDDVTLLEFTSHGQPAKALYALPSGTPRGIVVFDHGYSHTMYSWARHMARTSRQLGVITVTPDYRGQVDDLRHQPLPSSRGWQVQEGAEDTNAVAQLFDRLCLKGRGHNVLYSVSMGGNTAGLALAAQPRRSGGRPLWDEWVDVEGAANVLETYQGARLLAPVNGFAANATADIEREMGGTFEQRPERYRQLSVVNRTQEIAASGVKGVVMLHGVADGLVTHDISRQLQVLLRAQGVPVETTAFVTRSTSSEPGTTADGYLPTGLDSPFAGHASEASETHDVGLAGFAALAELYRGHRTGCSDRVVDGATGQTLRLYDGCA